MTRRPFAELGQELVGVVVGAGDDLPAEEAVLGCDVAFDGGEARDPAGVLSARRSAVRPPIECPTKLSRSICRVLSTCSATETRKGMETAPSSAQVLAPQPGAS